MTKRKIEDCQVKTDNDPDEIEYDGYNVQLNIDQQSYGEQSIPDDSNRVTKNCDQEIKKTQEILEQTDNMMKESSKESDQKSTTIRNNTLRLVTRQQTQSARGMSKEQETNLKRI